MKLTVLYNGSPYYVEQFYADRGDLAHQPYDVQRRALDADLNYGTSMCWGRALEPLGVEITEHIAVAEPAQRRWAIEHGDDGPGDDWLPRIALAQVQAARPDVVFVANYGHLRPPWFSRVRDVPGVRAVVGWVGAAVRSLEDFEGLDLVLSCAPETVDLLRGAGIPAAHLHHAVDDRALLTDPAYGSGDALSFVGRINRHAGYHVGRDAWLEALARSLPLAIYTPSALHPPHSSVRLAAKRLAYVTATVLGRAGVRDERLARVPLLRRSLEWEGRWPVALVNPRLRDHLRPPVWGLDLMRTLRGSRVTLNRHDDVTTTRASNRRTFEGPAAGTCLLTDAQADVRGLFEPDREVVSWTSVEDCVEKAQWLLDHTQEAAAIGAAGRLRVEREHTYAHRAEELLEHLSRAMRSRGSAT